jgi:hypothetical protein
MNKITLTMPQTTVPTEESLVEENKALKEKLLRLKRVRKSVTRELQAGFGQFGPAAGGTRQFGGREEVLEY